MRRSLLLKGPQHLCVISRSQTYYIGQLALGRGEGLSLFQGPIHQHVFHFQEDQAGSAQSLACD